MLIAIRGYYAVTMGPTEDNDIGIYDDAAFWIWSDRHGQHCRSFNYNTEPSKLTKGVATLKPGLYWYQKQLHRGQYPAFGQASKVYVQRHLQFLDHGFFGINLHYGSGSDTWSLGCQTVPKQQWPEFQHLGYEQLDRLSQRTFPYLLVTNRGDGKL
jgi:lysozyme